jgi:hypothetical protein
MCFLLHILYVEKYRSLLAVFFQSDSSAARSMAWVSSRSLAGIAKFESAGNMDISLL